MVYLLKIDDKVKKDLREIDKKWQIKILQALKSTLTNSPQQGKRLAGILSKYHRLRVGDYRIIYQILEKEVVVEVIKIKHRSKIYK